jgi:hypothetical protein
VKINREIAFSAIHNLILTCGGIAIFSFIAALKLFYMVPAIAGLGLLWYLLYRFEIAYRTQRLERFRY